MKSKIIFIFYLIFYISTGFGQSLINVNGVFWDANSGVDLDAEIFVIINNEKIKVGATDINKKFSFNLPTSADSLIFICKGFSIVSVPVHFNGAFNKKSSINIGVTTLGNLSQDQNSVFLLFCQPDNSNNNDSYILYGNDNEGNKITYSDFSLLMKNFVGHSQGRKISFESRELIVTRKTLNKTILFEKSFTAKKGFNFVDMNVYSNNKIADNINYTPTHIYATKSFGVRTVYFEQSKFDIKAIYKSTLDSLSIYLKENQNKNVGIKGYADNVGKPILNEELAKYRAKTVSNYLAQHGVFAKQMKVTWTNVSEIKNMQSEVQDLSKYRKVLIEVLNQ